MSVAYRTNTAIDYRTYDERVETERPVAARRPVRRSAVMARRVLMMFAAMLVAAVCIGLLFMKAQVFMAQRDINKIQKDIKIAQQLNSNLEEQYSEVTNINTIMDKASALGMGYATADQVLYVSLDGKTTSVAIKK